MFSSFFPNPKLFLISIIVWAGSCVTLWFSYGKKIGEALGFDLAPLDKPPLGIDHFLTVEFQWFSIYYLVTALMFYLFWHFSSKNKYSHWSVLGSSVIIFTTYLMVQFSVAYNNWTGPFYNFIQKALSSKEKVSLEKLYELIWQIVEVFGIGVLVYVLSSFLVSHYIFRWRTAMTNYYTANWSKVRAIEGASQRIQEDTMKFANIMENLGVALVKSVMTLIAFLPILTKLSAHVTELPIVGVIPYPLVISAIVWAIFGTVSLALVGGKLPGLEFDNQKVEAAYRKELVYGEDDSARAQPSVLTGLYSNVRKNYFKLYFHYTYFNIFRRAYVYFSWIIVLFLLAPTISVGTITFGIFTQVRLSFYYVGDSLQYLANSWTQIVDLLSIHKRLMAFERAMDEDNTDPSHPSDFDLDKIKLTEEDIVALANYDEYEKRNSPMRAMVDYSD